MSNHAIAGCRLYGFIDTGYLAGRSPAELTRALVAGGVDIIQVRAKELPHGQRVELALAVIGVAFRANVPVIINDDIDAAIESGADGVHLGQEDWEALVGQASRLSPHPHQSETGESPVPQKQARLAGMRIIGISTHSLEQALQAERDGATYIGVGPVFATGTKPNVAPVGIDLVKQVAGKIAVPFFAIGGITLQNVDEVQAAGATRIAVVSAILKSPDVAKAARKFKEKLV